MAMTWVTRCVPRRHTRRHCASAPEVWWRGVGVRGEGWGCGWWCELGWCWCGETGVVLSVSFVLCFHETRDVWNLISLPVCCYTLRSGSRTTWIVSRRGTVQLFWSSIDSFIVAFVGIGTDRSTDHGFCSHTFIVFTNSARIGVSHCTHRF